MTLRRKNILIIVMTAITIMFSMIGFNDLNIVSKKLPLNMRKADGIHYEPCAYAVFADKVSEVLKAHL